jgi:hypothetical protein
METLLFITFYRAFVKKRTALSYRFHWAFVSILTGLSHRLLQGYRNVNAVSVISSQMLLTGVS